MTGKGRHSRRGRWVGFVTVVVFVSVATLTLSANAFGQEEEPKEDVKGSQDHPLISRFPNSVILAYDQQEYDELVLILGGIDWGPNLRPHPSKSQKVEGKTTRILYLAPPSKTTLEIMRNYAAALKQAGFTVLYTCSGDEGCGGGESPRGDLMRQVIFPDNHKLKSTDKKYPASGWAFNFPNDQRFLSAKLARPEGDVYVSLYMAANNWDLPKWWKGRVAVLLEIVETKPLETGLIKVDASSLAKELANTGRVALYSIYFDFGKADLKPESRATLQEIARLLKANPDLKLYVVGHTDNVGSLEINLELSRRRAEAVVKALVAQFGIDPQRLKPYGIGPLAPVASNDTEEGRAKNRRVELVKQ